jgi:hypothetical protein
MLRDLYAQAESIRSDRRYAFDIPIVDEAHHVAPASPSTIGGDRDYSVVAKGGLSTAAHV